MSLSIIEKVRIFAYEENEVVLLKEAATIHSLSEASILFQAYISFCFPL